MNQSPAIIHYFIDSMVLACDKIMKYTQTATYEQFLTDGFLRDAVERNFLLLGESANKIPYSIQKKYKTIPWSSMYRLRNRIVHEFYDVDPEMLWCIIRNDLANNKNALIDMRNHPLPLTPKDKLRRR
jgi:uncharacterized protein with HEPN domain